MLLIPLFNHKDEFIVVNIQSSSNNTIINISTLNSKTLFCGSCGFLDIKGAKRASSYASQKISNILGKKLYSVGFRYIYVKLKGFGNGRYSSLKGFVLSGLKILNIVDITSICFNGCKSSKKRKV